MPFQIEVNSCLHPLPAVAAVVEELPLLPDEYGRMFRMASSEAQAQQRGEELGAGQSRLLRNLKALGVLHALAVQLPPDFDVASTTATCDTAAEASTLKEASTSTTPLSSVTSESSVSEVAVEEAASAAVSPRASSPAAAAIAAARREEGSTVHSLTASMRGLVLQRLEAVLCSHSNNFRLAHSLHLLTPLLDGLAGLCPDNRAKVVGMLFKVAALGNVPFQQLCTLSCILQVFCRAAAIFALAPTYPCHCGVLQI